MRFFVAMLAFGGPELISAISMERESTYANLTSAGEEVDSIDVSKDGLVSKDEDVAFKEFDAMDGNKDGFVSKEEYVTFKGLGSIKFGHDDNQHNLTEGCKFVYAKGDVPSHCSGMCTRQEGRTTERTSCMKTGNGCACDW